jgi:type I restriction enzyme S subunit
MASEWREQRWGDLATLEYGRALRGHGQNTGRFRVFGTNGPIGWHDEALCPHPGVIVGRKGAYRGVHYSPAPFFVIDTAFYLSPKTQIDLRWAYYELLAQDINSLDSGSAIPSTSRESFYSLPVRVPPLPEQRAIAHILGTLDDKIELNRRKSETLEAMARALFKSWFVDFDPVRAKMEGRWRRGQSLPGLPAHLYDLFPDCLVDSELGEIPEGWEVKSLDEIARFLNGLALQRYPPADGRSLPVIKIAQLRSGHTTGADRASADLDPDYVVDDGDILFSWSGSLECVVWAGGRGALNQHLFKVTSERYPRWLCYFGVHAHLDDFCHIAAGKATTMGHIQRHHLSSAKLAVPPSPLLGAMDTYILPIFEASWKRCLESRTLVTVRDALLPKLISGELRVKDAEKFIERVAS